MTTTKEQAENVAKEIRQSIDEAIALWQSGFYEVEDVMNKAGIYPQDYDNAEYVLCQYHTWVSSQHWITATPDLYAECESRLNECIDELIALTHE